MDQRADGHVDASYYRSRDSSGDAPPGFDLAFHAEAATIQDGGTDHGSVAFSDTPGRAIPDTLYGLTSESVASLRDLKASVERHTRNPTVRIVFQHGTKADEYKQTIGELRTVGYLMGQVLDSTALAKYSTRQYRTRVRDFVTTYGNRIDIWEIGNELNGEWLGQPEAIRAKVQAAYEVVHREFRQANLRSAITLNYWPSSDCFAKPWEDTERFARSLSSDVRSGVNYVLLSFYETACDPRARPSVAQFAVIFKTLAAIFPNAKLGFGEVGAQGKADGFATPSFAAKQRIAQTYYGMHEALRSRIGARYVGGYFWWYYDQDAVPYDHTESMWGVLERLFNSY